ncbi:MAG: Ig-like domain-containing protein [bacterium]|nr:Ig-like domain-containing protein [bacterium]
MKTKVFQKVVSITLSITTILWSFGAPLGVLFAPGTARAAVAIVVSPGTVNANFPGPIMAGSAATAVAKISVTASVISQTVQAVAVNFSGTGFLTTDLLAIATGDTSGVALYEDTGNVAGTFVAGSDPVVTLAGTPNWTSSTTNITLTPATSVALTSTVAKIFYIVIKTAAPGTLLNGDQIVATIPAGGVVTTEGANSSSVTLTPVIADTVVPTISSVSGFSGSTTVTVNFSEPVQKVGGGNLAFVSVTNPLDYTDGGGTAEDIASAGIAHTAGQPMATITMDATIDAEDVDAGPATMAAGSNNIADMAGNVMLTTPARNFSSPLTITTVVVPSAIAGASYASESPLVQFAASGGTGSPSFTANSAGDTATLSALALTLGTDGKLTTATTLANTPGSFQVNIKVTAGTTATKLFTINVQPIGGGAIPGITGVAPAGAGTSSTPSIVITGSNTTFTSASVVTVSLPPGSADTNGITVGVITRNSATSITAPLTIDSTATAGSRDVRVVTGAEVVNMPGGFGVFTSGGSGLGLLLPTDAATSVLLPSPSFNFTPSSNTTTLNSYRITVASTSDFATKVWDYTFPKPSDGSNTNGSHCSSTGCNVNYGAGTFLILTQPVSLTPNTTYYWKVSTYAEATGSVSAAPVALETTGMRSLTTTASVSDSTPPTIMHRPVFQAKASTNLVMFARVMDNLATSTSTPALTTKIIYCPGSGCTPTTSTGQANGSSVGAGYFSYTIPSATISTAGTIVRYYLQASDGTTNPQNFYQTGTTPFQLTSVAAAEGSVTITGTVKDSTNTCATAVQSARVFAEGTGFSATTDGSCAFTLGGASPNGLFTGTYDLVALKDGYGNRTIDGIPAGATSIPFQLTSGAGGGFGGDTTKPTVRFTMPGNDMTNMPGGDSNMKIVVVFSKTMSQSSITSTNLTVNDATTGSLVPITANGSWIYYSTAPTNTPMIPPEANMAVWSLTSPNTLGNNKTIAVVVTSNVTDTAGNSVQGNQSDGSYAFSFTTSNSTFTGTLSGTQSFGQGAFMPPRVIGTTPTPGSSSAPTNTKVVINFSDPMADDSGTYVLKNYVKLFTVSGTTETDVSSSAIDTVTLSTSKLSAVVTLKSTYNSGAFAASTKYRVKALGGAKGSSGMTLGIPGQESSVFYTLEFTTGTGGDTAAPTVVGSYPSNGDAGVQVNVGAMNVGFSKDMDPSTISTSTITLTVGSTSVNGTVEYRPLERMAYFLPRSVLNANTAYTLTVTTGVTGLNGTPLGTAVTKTFTTGSADSIVPAMSFMNADDFGIALTFSEPMNAAKATDTMNWATSVLNPLAYNVIKYGSVAFDPASVGTAVSLASATFSYDTTSSTVLIKGLAIAAAIGQELYLSMDVSPSSNSAKDLSANVITSAGNTSRTTIGNSLTTKGSLGPMATTTDAFSGGGTFIPTNFSSTTFGFAPPVNVMPRNMMAGKTTTYMVMVPISKQIPISGTIVLTFPTGFDVTAAQQDLNSPMRTDLNGPGTGTPTFKCTTNVAGGKSCAGGATVTGDTSSGDDATKGGLADDGVVVNTPARTVTVNLSSATNSGGNDFLNIDIAGIVNSSVPKDFNTAGYTVDIKTKNGATVLESLTSMPFFIQTAGSYTLSGTITATGATGLTAKVYLMSPMTGPTETTSGTFAANAGAYSFTALPAGEYMLFTDQTVTLTGGEFTGKTAPERVVISEATDLASDTVNNDVIDYDFTLANNASTNDATVLVDITGTVGELLDVFAGSSMGTGFKVKQVTLDTSPKTVTLRLAVGKWFVGVGPQMPKGPMGGPPPAPNYIMPRPLDITVVTISPDTFVENSGTANNGTLAFTLTSATKSIQGLVKDGSGKVMANAEVYAYSPQGGFGTHANTDTAGAFTLSVVDGSYIVGSFIPGMPPSKEVPVVVTSHSTQYLLIDGATTTITPATAATTFVLKVAKPDYTISGKVTDGTNTVQGASVFAYRTDGPGFANANTDSAGTYTLYVSNGTWKVGSFLPQYGNLTEQTITVLNASQSNVNFTPTGTGTFYTVSGRVYQDITVGGGFNGSDVAIQGSFVRISGNSTSNEAITGADGTYSVKVPSGTGYTIKASAPGIGELAGLSGVSVLADTANQDITLTVPRTITITLSTSVAEAFIELFSSTGVGGRVVIKNTTTGILSVPNGDYSVNVQMPGVVLTSTAIAATTGDTVYSNTTGIVAVNGAEGLTVTVPTLRTVSGTVTDGSAAVADAWVEIADSSNGARTGVKAGSDGTFTLKVTNSATAYKINAMKPGYFRDATSITVTSAVANATLTGLTIAMSASTLSITGTVYIGSTGAANAFVRAEKQGGGFSGTQADATGAYTLPVNAGTWRVYGVADGYAEAAAASAVVIASSSQSGVNITVSTTVSLAAPKSKPMIPASGGTLEDATSGIKITVPEKALGSSMSAGNIQAKQTNNVRSTSTSKPVGGKAQEIKAIDSDNNAITTLPLPVTVEMTLTLAEMVATVSSSDSSINTLAEADTLKMGYWDDSAQSWITLASTITYKNSAGTVITDETTIDTAAEFSATVATATVSASTDHFSLYAPISSVGSAPPATPTGLAAVTGGQTQINLSWTAVTSDPAATGYDIYRSATSGGTYDRVGSEPTVSSGSTTAFSDTGLSSGVTYFYKISAVNASGESASSSAVSTATSTAGAGATGGSSSTSITTPVTTPTTPTITTTTPTTTPTIPTPTPATTTTPTTLQLIAIPAVPANPTTAQVQAAIVAILNNISYLRAQLAILIATEQPGSKDVPPHCRGIVFSNALKVGSTGNEVKCLQALLNQDTSTKVTSSGVGSPGNETTLFGSLTKAAVVKFQEKYASSILTPSGLTAGTGIIGPATRAKLNALLGK